MASTALITGSSSGIGRHLAVHLSRTNRYKIALFGRNRAALDETYKMMKDANGSAVAELFVHDLASTDRQQLQKTVVDCCENFGGKELSLLVNSAGIGSSGHIEDIDLEETERMLQVNVNSVIQITKHCIPYLKNRVDANDDSNRAVINIGSISSLPINVGVDRSIYMCTKHALKGFSDCLFADVSESGIKVCCIMPMWTNTEIISKIQRNNFLIPYKHQLIQPSDIAKSVDYVLDCSPWACPTEILIRTHKKFV